MLHSLNGSGRTADSRTEENLVNDAASNDLLTQAQVILHHKRNRVLPSDLEPASARFTWSNDDETRELLKQPGVIAGSFSIFL
ncbi:unnamed protein product [Protopolystoma xenopodis]|uniref:Uncharacterized protein n=1 Tax=Protopolystoma xenopodis TaxID=117903 RepID=A0A3S5ALG6_9PLAT|nr:unnamed protein product [Protopolystoma xenopodis]